MRTGSAVQYPAGRAYGFRTRTRRFGRVDGAAVGHTAAATVQHGFPEEHRARCQHRPGAAWYEGQWYMLRAFVECNERAACRARVSHADGQARRFGDDEVGRSAGAALRAVSVIFSGADPLVRAGPPGPASR